MNLLKTKDLIILFDKVDKSLNFLINKVILNEEDTKKLNSFENEFRKRQWLTVRYMINKHFKGQTIISYNSKGKPFLLTRNESISISHSGIYVVIAISRFKDVAIDIQQYSSKLEKVKSKFATFKENDIPLLWLWCVKETVYKFNFVGITSLTDIFVKRLRNNVALVYIEKLDFTMEIYGHKIGPFLITYGYIK